MTSDTDVLARARAWLAQDPDPETAAELRALIDAGAVAELTERFAGVLEFGTAGIRGVLGAGPMRMNRVVVRQVSAGLADYLLATLPDAAERGVVIGRDARRNSDVFAQDAAQVMLGKGLKVFVITEPAPTPLVAFAVTDRGAAGGVMVTASHNPPEYNGYKVYWENGAQIIVPHDAGIAAAIARQERTDGLALPALETARAEGRLVELGAKLEARYLAGVRELSIHPDAAAQAPLAVAYTPMHGVGGKLVAAAMAQAGFESLAIEPSQAEPDGAFPTVRFPNPEEPGAMDRVLALAGSVGADLVLANDPDADRLAVALPDGDGYRMLSGDQIGLLLADYLLAEGPAGRRLVASTIVSSQLLERMAEALGVDYRATLTGFKWLANAAMTHKAEHGSRFVLGYEEALGYSVGELVRDKDGVSAAVIMTELAAWAKARGQTVAQRLDDLYRRFGLYLTEQVSLTLPGAEGLARIAALMARFRATPPEAVGGRRVARVDDIARGDLGLPVSDVLIFRLEGDQRVIMRPSGTEPKLKSYYEVREPVAEGEPLGDAMERARAQLGALRDAHQRLLG